MYPERHAAYILPRISVIRSDFRRSAKTAYAFEWLGHRAAQTRPGTPRGRSSPAAISPARDRHPRSAGSRQRALDGCSIRRSAKESARDVFAGTLGAEAVDGVIYGDPLGKAVSLGAIVREQVVVAHNVAPALHGVSGTDGRREEHTRELVVHRRVAPEDVVPSLRKLNAV